MAHDASRGEVVMFGGQGGGHETWVWNGTSWANRTPADPSLSPSDRYDHAMAYDAQLKKVILFGGYAGGYKQDTWTWDGATMTWQKVSESGPPARKEHAIAYDTGRQKLVLFGGQNGPDLGDTWEWDGTTLSWTNRTPADPATLKGFNFQTNDIAFSYEKVSAPIANSSSFELEDGQPTLTVGLSKDGTTAVPLPGDANGAITESQKPLLPVDNRFILFRPNGTGGYTASIETSVP